MKKQEYYLGLDIGTDSVGYAVTDKQYNLLKFHGKEAWGVQVFDAASLNDERRAFRTARRRLDRRQQRVLLLQELFATEINKVDPRFFIRIKESALYGKDDPEKGLFSDPDYGDKDYFRDYPTIHHLISELMQSNKPHDVRLVYLACAWLVAHRGHFLSNIDINNIEAAKDFDVVYDNLMDYFTNNGYIPGWDAPDRNALAATIKKKTGVTNKQRELVGILMAGKKPEKEPTEDFPFSQDAIIKLLAGGTCKVKDLFGKDEYEEYGSLSLGMDEEKFAELAGNIGEDFDVVALLRSINDWAVLVDVLGGYASISEAKVSIYEQHKKDLALLKKVMRKYTNKKTYDEVFRAIGKDNYVAYSYHTNDGNTEGIKKKSKEDFSKYILGVLKNVSPDEEDKDAFDDMIARLSLNTFMPKQKDTDNRVIPHQMYQVELNRILDNAKEYLPFLTETDDEGLSVSDKVKSIFTFRIPYFVGPLNTESQYSWVVRKAGKITPWNFDKMVDLDASEQAFIQRMTNTCTYLPGEPVLPKDSLCYHRFMVLNEINNIRINGVRIPVELKQRLYNELFMNVKKVTLKRLQDWFISNGELDKDHREAMTGVDITINSDLKPQIAFKRLLESGKLTEEDVESIIERASYAEDKTRLMKWLNTRYAGLDEDDKKYICSIKIHDFGRLSRKFLTELEGTDKETGEILTIMGALWNTQNNLMELRSERFTFEESIEDFRRDYYGGRKMLLKDRLDEMYISNAVRRPIYRTLDIVGDVKKAFGEPKKIFIEVTRGGTEEQRGKRTKSRRQQILDLYRECRDQDVKLLQQQLEALGEAADNKLQGDKLFLYFMQLGKCMYSGETIELEKLGSKAYDIDHIYPQAFVKDDSIINNKVLVLAEENGKKKDTYPISADVRKKMGYIWKAYLGAGLISEEKYRRLTRTTGFTEEEKYAFINRQIVETSQATKAVASILKDKFPEAEIVYSKARLVSEFRQEFELYKSRLFNDLHHAVDAYLNIVTGNVYQMKFTKEWFNVNAEYSIKTRTIFTHPLVCGDEMVWDGKEMLAKAKKTAVKNTAHFNKFAYFKHGGLFDQMPVTKAEGLVPLKKGMPTEKYGGYNKSGAMFYIPVRYRAGKKNEVLIMSVELMFGERFLQDENFAREYSFGRLEHILGKKVDEVSFPMGMRPWKVNTILSLDGFRVNISGIAGGGRCLIAQPAMQFMADPHWQYYLKKLEMFCEKAKKNANYIYDVNYDKVTKEENIQLYSLYMDKAKNSVYKNRVNSPKQLLKNGQVVFENLDIFDQSSALLSIHQSFGRIAGGCDFSLIGGTKRAAATVNFSSTVSNWRSSYGNVRIIDSAASGLWEKESQNLLELI